ncbi:primosomal protein N' [Arenimonas caeni]|jgi:primosomal protein N' (replication factor Y)|uniref:primosomal protein N' n=1 Tax=Arenimonas caeni TaxID=2058085 RepID=UPI002A35C64F|nr:primosomal protein N' [Arenimonas caeni]MDY0021521.1 primosomal protein N' [Arenimonas caeni]
MDFRPVPVLHVALPVPLPRDFDYLPPAGALPGPDWVGCRVRVPFGRGDGEQVGVVVGVGESDADPASLKPVLARLDAQPLLQGELLESLRWTAGYYHAPLGEVLATALPGLLRAGQPVPDTRRAGWRATPAGRDAAAAPGRKGRPRELLQLLCEQDLAEDELDTRLPGWRPAARSLAERGLAGPTTLEPAAAPLARSEAPTLTPAQAEAVAALRGSSGFQPVLLEGVTGSGKTEVYLQAIADCLAAGRQALVLVPEIGLTPQALGRFRARLGVPVAAFHSGLSDGERARAWVDLAEGRAGVLVGTRSAVFCPMARPGLLVVDEEHDGSYKQQDGVRYHARDLALVRASKLGIPVILGSATPSLESLHNALSGRYLHLRLGQRAGGASPPRVRVLDVRKRPLADGLSGELLDAVAACLARGEQALVFKNRRGYAPVLICHDCGWSAHCRRCDAAMTVHAGGRRLICHHCGARATPPDACPDCASLALQPQGAGTERLEQALAARFPGATLVRVDRETTRRRDALGQHLASLGDGPGILVGTQILAKGHDLPRLTLVAVVGVDEGLFSADFRAGEKLAQLLIQVAGRAGRSTLPGEVVLQTHHPDHPLLGTLLHGGYPAVAALALAEREAAGFPPYAYLALLRAEAGTEAAVQAFLQEAHAAFPAREGVRANAPMPAPMARRAGRARGQLLLDASQRPPLHAALREWLPLLRAMRSARKVRWSLDVDPTDLY